MKSWKIFFTTIICLCFVYIIVPPSSANSEQPTKIKKTWYKDADRDGFGTYFKTKLAFKKPSGYVSNSADCDDTKRSVNPKAKEYCNKRDNDCNGIPDDNAVNAPVWYLDSDGDGFGTQNLTQRSCFQPYAHVKNSKDCNDEHAEISPRAKEVDDNQIDDNCNGKIDE